jgi:hypothetical protein
MKHYCSAALLLLLRMQSRCCLPVTSNMIFKGETVQLRSDRAGDLRAV